MACNYFIVCNRSVAEGRLFILSKRFMLLYQISKFTDFVITAIICFCLSENRKKTFSTFLGETCRVYSLKNWIVLTQILKF